MAKSDNIEQIIDHTLFSAADIEKCCRRLGAKLTADYAGKKPLVVGALRGAIFFMTDLLRHMDVKEELDFIDVSSYGNGFSSSGKVRVLSDLASSVKGRDVLIVEDIVDTGQTLQFMKSLLLKRGAKSVRCCVLLNKTANRSVHVKIDYYGFHVDNEFVVGYGMDFLNMYRNIPFIGVLKPEIIKKYINK